MIDDLSLQNILSFCGDCYWSVSTCHRWKCAYESLGYDKITAFYLLPVRERIAIWDDERHLDEAVGWTFGLNSINQVKNYMAHNMRAKLTPDEFTRYYVKYHNNFGFIVGYKCNFATNLI
jgi:hypothetical protein